jgi:hypothetical protein
MWQGLMGVCLFLKPTRRESRFRRRSDIHDAVLRHWNVFTCLQSNKRLRLF